MPKVAKELSAIEVKRLTHMGSANNETFAVGGVAGLLLQVTQNGARTWLLRTKVGDKRREIGFGSYPEVSLAVARERAKEAKAGIRVGIDPVEHKRVVRAAVAAEQKRGLKFDNAVDQHLGAKLSEFKNIKHRAQWVSTLKTYAIPILGPMLVSEITVQDVLLVLKPIWHDKTETAKRLRGRIERVLSSATVMGHRTGANPARWKDNLEELLPAPSKITKPENQPAVRIEDITDWFSKLKMLDGVGSRALEFLTLNASRSGEVRGAVWSEIDMERKLWTIPAVRMKMDREHIVPLSEPALELLTRLPRIKGNPLIFPAPRGGQLSDMTLSATMRRMHEREVLEGRIGFLDRRSGRRAVPHGLRSTFRDWVGDKTTFDGYMAELALAHKIGDKTEAAYLRADMIEKRRLMMQAWSQMLNGQKIGEIMFVIKDE